MFYFIQQLAWCSLGFISITIWNFFTLLNCFYLPTSEPWFRELMIKGNLVVSISMFLFNTTLSNAFFSLYDIKMWFSDHSAIISGKSNTDNYIISISFLYFREVDNSSFVKTTRQFRYKFAVRMIITIISLLFLPFLCFHWMFPS